AAPSVLPRPGERGRRRGLRRSAGRCRADPALVPVHGPGVGPAAYSGSAGSWRTVPSRRLGPVSGTSQLVHLSCGFMVGRTRGSSSGGGSARRSAPAVTPDRHTGAMTDADPIRRAPPPFHEVEVRAVEALTPRMQRVTLAGAGLLGFEVDGP